MKSGEKQVKIKKGMDIKLKGHPSTDLAEVQVTKYALKPTDFEGMSPIPKVEKEIGDSIKAGEVLFYDKKRPEIKYVSPVSGKFVALNRGPKRRIDELVIEADNEMSYHKHGDVNLSNRQDVIDFMLTSGAWSLLLQRPFGIVPDHTVTPKNIFISSFDTAPFAPSTSVVVKGKESAIKKAVEVLSSLTDGKVYIGMDTKTGGNISELNGDMKAERVWFNGPHPAGNVGIQIHHISPINSGDVVWTLGLQDLITIGRLFEDGIYDAARIMTIAGEMLNKPSHIKAHQGASISELLQSFSGLEGSERIISGDVLSGEKVEKEGYVGFYADQVSIIEEGDYYEMFGWMIPGRARPSLSRTFTSFLFKNKRYKADSNMHGERRAFVITGQYEKVLPMDIYPQHLFKAIITNDYEKMEGLGIYELLEEDVALCEYVCTSKMPLQSILREGLDTVREQG